MKVQDWMKKEVAACGPDADLGAAARMFWEWDCGCIPVVDEERRVMGVLTDRDVCMAALLSGRPLHDLRVADSMSPRAHTCHPGDSIDQAMSAMASHQVRRLPVVDETGRLQGILSLNDVARGSIRIPKDRERHAQVQELAEAFAAICEPRGTSRVTGLEVHPSPAAAVPKTAKAAGAKAPKAPQAKARSAAPPRKKAAKGARAATGRKSSRSSKRSS